jgi:hypothetical protein
MHVAVTDRAGEMTYFVTNSGVSGGLTKHDTPRPVEWQEISVPSATLDELFSGLVPDFIKIDVEGAELSVLRGAQRILDHGSTSFLIELYDWPSGADTSSEVTAVMRRAGYLRGSFYGQPLFVTSRRLWLRLVLMELLHNPYQALRRWRHTLRGRHPSVSDS